MNLIFRQKQTEIITRVTDINNTGTTSDLNFFLKSVKNDRLQNQRAIGVEKPVGITQGKIIYQAVVLQANRQFSSVTMDEGSYSLPTSEMSLNCSLVYEKNSPL